jgi:transposase
MRQTHRAGEKTFVDYAGQTVEVVDPTTGEVREAQVFVAVLGASSFTYAEATWTQGLADWIGSHQRTFRFFDGVTDVLVPDNLRSGVTRAHRYEPDLNPTYAEMAAHYSITILPARVRKPRDKAKVEVAVQIVERWILSRLRHQTFFSLDEVNRAIAELLPLVNERPFKKLPGSRRTLYEQLDRPALAPLPAERYEFATWKKARVNIDYHIELERHYYSVPYQLVKLEVEARLTESTVEILHRGRRVASHRRSFKVGGFTTVAAHMPRPHRDYAEWTPKRLVRWAEKTGHATAELVEAILSRRRHPQQGFRSCLGLFRLGQDYGEARLEAACRRALHIGALSYKSIESILKHKLDQEPLPEPAHPALPLKHDNVRGPKYYH